MFCQQTGGMLIPTTRGRKIRLESSVLVHIKLPGYRLDLLHVPESEQDLCPQFVRASLQHLWMLLYIKIKKKRDTSQKTFIFVLLCLDILL